MFEIIMLLAFLYAATSQLLPAKTVTTRPPLNKKTRGASRLSICKLQTRRKILAKIKSRSHSYADAA